MCACHEALCVQACEVWVPIIAAHPDALSEALSCYTESICCVQLAIMALPNPLPARLGKTPE